MSYHKNQPLFASSSDDGSLLVGGYDGSLLVGVYECYLERFLVLTVESNQERNLVMTEFLDKLSKIIDILLAINILQINGETSGGWINLERGGGEKPKAQPKHFTFLFLTVQVSHGMVYDDLLKNALVVPLKPLRGHEITEHIGRERRGVNHAEISRVSM